MKVLTISTSTFDNFGKVSYGQFSHDNTYFITDANHSDDKIELFKNLCLNIFTHKCEFNLYLFQNLIFHLVNRNAKLIDETIIQIFDEITNQMYNKINNSTKNITFSINLFTELYNEYYKNSVSLAKYLSYFDNNVIKENSNRYSHIGLIRNYAFYNNVINNKYEYKDGKYYLYEIFTKCIENNEVTINDVIKLFKMYSFYIRFSYTPINNKDTLFNQEINKLFLATLGSNKEFIKNIVQYIHMSVKAISEKYVEATLNNLEELISLITNYVNEKYMFNLYYEKFFEMRLVNFGFNYDIEKKLISKFKRPTDNKIIQNMLYKLSDMENCKEDKNNYEKCQVTIASDKYLGKINVDQLNRNIINPKVFRFYAWSHNKEVNEQEELAVPFELSPYVDIFNGYYKVKYPYRNLNWNFNQGTGIIKLTLGGKTYQLQLTTPQLFLILQFNVKSEIPAIELSSLMGVSMATLGPILNSLLQAHVLKREENKLPTDPTMLIFLNKDFKYESEKISLVGLMNTNQQKLMDNEINEKFSIGRDTVLQARIVKEIKISKHLSHSELFQKVKIALPFNFDEQKFNEMIDICIKDNYLKKNDDLTYEYIEEPNDD